MPRERKPSDLNGPSGFYTVLDVYRKFPQPQALRSEIARLYPGATREQIDTVLTRVLDAQRFGSRLTTDINSRRERPIFAVQVPGLDPTLIRIEGTLEFFDARSRSIKEVHFRVEVSNTASTLEALIAIYNTVDTYRGADPYEEFDFSTPLAVNVDIVITG